MCAIISPPGSGEAYYVNSRTGESSWSEPWGWGAADGPDAAGVADGGGGDGDAAAAAAERASASAARSTGGASGDSKADWEAVPDAESGVMYWLNLLSGAISWEPPDFDGSLLPPGWKARTDVETKGTFYIHEVTTPRR